MNPLTNRIKVLASCTALAIAAAGTAQASAVLTADGVSLGFTLTDFATGLPSTCNGCYGYGPFGMAVVDNGSGGTNVLVSDYASSTLYVFNNADGQTPGSAITTQASSSGVQAYASLNGVAYGSNGSTYGSFSSTGVFTPFSISGLPSPYLGLAGDAATGELIAMSNSGLIAINPTAGTFRTIVNTFGDGVSVSPDGSIAYLETAGTVKGYDVQTGALVFSATPPSGGWSPDGTGVISSTNALNGSIVVNDNYGNVFLVDPTGANVVKIATNAGQRGDYTAPDYSNGSLLLAFSTEIARLSCGPNCSIGSPPVNQVPVPLSAMMLGSGLLGLLGLRRKRKAS